MLGCSEDDAEGLDSWTLISTREFAAENKVPQENVPREVELRVKQEMISDFERVLGLAAGSIEPVYQAAQLWGAAVPLNRLANVGFAFDIESNIGICGDWFSPVEDGIVPTGPSIESAYLSGRQMAALLVQRFVKGSTSPVGIDDDAYFEAIPQDSPALDSVGSLGSVTSAAPAPYLPGPRLGALPVGGGPSGGRGRGCSRGEHRGNADKGA